MSQSEHMDEKLSKVRHSMSHVMAEAVLQMFPTAQIAIGPAIENGFYYDFDLPRTLTSEDLDEISAADAETSRRQGVQAVCLPREAKRCSPGRSTSRN